ncbi:MAG: DUF1761 domain-containing protein [Xanthobacteraceae bacterium]
MQFAGVNYLAILIAAVAAWFAGAVWYMAFAKPWVTALGKTMEQFKAEQADNVGKPAAMAPFILAFAASLLMAWVLAGVLGHLGPGQVTVRNGVITGLFCWSGFVFTTMLVNNSFAMRSPRLLVIDGGYWLAVLVMMGAIIGAMGV